jgi:hypothetical protein
MADNKLNENSLKDTVALAFLNDPRISSKPKNLIAEALTRAPTKN